MGCDIHMITQILKDGKWQYVPEKPESYDARNYNVFSFLADVRTDFPMGGFEAKGLPKDLGDRMFCLHDYEVIARARYDTEMVQKAIMPDGRIFDIKSPQFGIPCKTAQEAKNTNGITALSATQIRFL